MFPNRFADISALEKREVVNANTRRFEGDGSPFLVLSGAPLLDITAVVIGTTEIPLKESRRYVEDSTGRETAPVDEPLIDLQATADGRQVLLRSPLSNHGLWQKGVPVYVTGTWGNEGDPVPVPAKTDDEADGKDKEDESFDDASFESLSDELKAKIQSFGSLEAAQAAALDESNDKFKAAGITGNDIQRARAAIKKTIPA